MTATAIESEFTIVYVVGAMATSATAIDRRYFIQWDSVTVLAQNAHMSALEREFGLQVMIESPDIPVNRVVARIATIMKIAAMRVVVPMARDALRWRITKNV